MAPPTLFVFIFVLVFEFKFEFVLVLVFVFAFIISIPAALALFNPPVVFIVFEDFSDEDGIVLVISFTLFKLLTKLKLFMLSILRLPPLLD